MLERYEYPLDYLDVFQEPDYQVNYDPNDLGTENGTLEGCLASHKGITLGLWTTKVIALCLT
jgi:hypothetical protein